MRNLKLLLQLLHALIQLNLEWTVFIVVFCNHLQPSGLQLSLCGPAVEHHQVLTDPVRLEYSDAHLNPFKITIKTRPLGTSNWVWHLCNTWLGLFPPNKPILYQAGMWDWDKTSDKNCAYIRIPDCPWCKSTIFLLYMWNISSKSHHIWLVFSTQHTINSSIKTLFSSKRKNLPKETKALTTAKWLWRAAHINAV